MRRRSGVFSLLILLLFLASGCSRYISISSKDTQTGFTSLNNQTSLGQTFTARFSGLAGVGLIMRPNKVSQAASEAEIIFHLRASPQSAQDLRTTTLPVEKIDQTGNYRFFFQPLPDSNQQDYYFLLEMKGAGEVGVGISDNGAYLDGACYKNGVASDGQLVFNLKYESARLSLGLISEISTWLIWLITGLFLFIIPGWALLSLAWSGWQKMDLLGKFSLAGGTSLAIYPVFFLFTYVVGLHLGALYAWLPLILGMTVILWRNARVFIKRFGKKSEIKSQTPITDNIDIPGNEATVQPVEQSMSVNARIRLHFLSPDPGEGIDALAAAAAQVVLIAAIIFSRFWIIRSLDFPLWGDSYQHTLIAQLLVDNRGLFQSWLPYAELSTFTYHFGFHTLVACFNWISGFPMEKAVLWVGQIVNILAIIALYPLAKKLGKNRWSGPFVLLIAGLISSVPMSFVNWGRYTQLAGQAILPVAIFFTWRLLSSNHLNRRLLVINWIILGGLALSHYRVLIFMLLFYAAYILMHIRSGQLPVLIKKVFWSAIGGAVIFLPWLVLISPYKIVRNLLAQLTTLPDQASKFMIEYNKLGNPFEFFPPVIWIGVAAAIFWTIWRWRKNFITIILWWCLVFLSANPMWFGLPGIGAISNFAVKIANYIPVGIILGAFMAKVSEKIHIDLQSWNRIPLKTRTTLRFSLSLALFFVITIVSIISVNRRIDDILPAQYALATRPDQRAALWIKENTQPEDRFLVNSFFAYGGSVIAGSDGGWWLPLLTKRASTQPPLNYGTEEGFVQYHTEQVNLLVETLDQKGFSDPETQEALISQGVDYIYIGQQQGHVNSPRPLVDINILKNNPHYKMVYHQDRVWIFNIID
jgi:hypothetical protein